MRVTAGPRLGPGGSGRGGPGRAGRRLRRVSRRSSPRLGGELLGAGARRASRRGRSSSPSRTTTGPPTRRRSRPRSGTCDPSRPGGGAGADRPGAEPAHRRLPGAGGRRAARRAVAARAVRGGPAAGAIEVAAAQLVLGCVRRRRCGWTVVQPPGGKPMSAADFLRGHAPPAKASRRSIPSSHGRTSRQRHRRDGRRRPRPRRAPCSARTARAAASRGCAPRSSRGASSASTACAASSSSRSAPTAASTGRSAA